MFGHEKDGIMLARRFTIVCLLVAIFGMGLAMLVTEAKRPAYSWQAGTAPCLFENGLRCAQPMRR